MCNGITYSMYTQKIWHSFVIQAAGYRHASPFPSFMKPILGTTGVSHCGVSLRPSLSAAETAHNVSSPERDNLSTDAHKNLSALLD